MTDQMTMYPMPPEPSADEAIRFLREHEPPAGYWGAFSGGKDSVAIKHLARMAGVNVRWHHNLTTIDPPELVRFVIREHADVMINRPSMHMLRMAVDRGFPTRRGRWCCKEYKETFRPPGFLIMGIRAEESARRRAQWAPVTPLRKSRTTAILPILEWDSEYLWEFIHSEGIPYCGLYDDGFKRLGCVGCPMSGKQRIADFARWPGIEKQWKRAFERIWEKRSGSIQRNGVEWFGNRFFDGWQGMWHWWLHDSTLPERQGLFEFEANARLRAAGRTR